MSEMEDVLEKVTELINLDNYAVIDELQTKLWNNQHMITMNPLEFAVITAGLEALREKIEGERN